MVCQTVLATDLIPFSLLVHPASSGLLLAGCWKRSSEIVVHIEIHLIKMLRRKTQRVFKVCDSQEQLAFASWKKTNHLHNTEGLALNLNLSH